MDIIFPEDVKQEGPLVIRPNGHPPIDPFQFNRGTNANDNAPVGSLPFARLYQVDTRLLGLLPVTFRRPHPQIHYTLLDQNTMIQVRREDNYLQTLNVQVPRGLSDVKLLEPDGGSTILTITERVHIPVTLADGRTCFMLMMIVSDPLDRSISILGTDNDQTYLRII